MVDLASLANLATALALLVALFFGAFQLGQERRKRRDLAAIELVHSFQSPELVRSIRLIWEVPEGLTGPELRARGIEFEDRALGVGTTMETIGVMVYRRIVPLEIVEELMGGAITRFWSRLTPWAEMLRKEQNRKAVFERFQWLAERLEENRLPSKHQGAHVAYRNWQPRHARQGSR